MWDAFAVEVPPPEEEDDKEEEGEEEEKEDGGAQPGELAITGKRSDSDGSGTAPPSRKVWEVEDTPTNRQAPPAHI